MIDIHQQSDGVVHLIINRPKKKNALTRDMYERLTIGISTTILLHCLRIG